MAAAGRAGRARLANAARAAVFLVRLLGVAEVPLVPRLSWYYMLCLYCSSHLSIVLDVHGSPTAPVPLVAAC